jgi:uncharacterized ion transporter superfamily protein YfcC
MATQEFHEEILKWNNLEKLLDLSKFNCGHQLNLLYWTIGILITIFVLTIGIKDAFYQLPYGLWIQSGTITFFGIAIIVALVKTRNLHKVLYGNISYLSRKIDGQFEKR